jgi:hypothetical protein
MGKSTGFFWGLSQCPIFDFEYLERTQKKKNQQKSVPTN